MKCDCFYENRCDGVCTECAEENELCAQEELLEELEEEDEEILACCELAALLHMMLS